MSDYEHFMETLRKAGFQNGQAMHDLYLTSPVNAETLCLALAGLRNKAYVASIIEGFEQQAPATTPGGDEE